MICVLISRHVELYVVRMRYWVELVQGGGASYPVNMTSLLTRVLLSPAGARRAVAAHSKAVSMYIIV